MQKATTGLAVVACHALIALFTVSAVLAQTGNTSAGANLDTNQKVGIDRLIEEYGQASQLGWNADERLDAYSRWLTAFTTASESQEDHPLFRQVQAIRLSLANGLSDFTLSRLIAEELVVTATDTSEEIFWRLEAGEISNQQFLASGDAAEAQQAIDSFVNAREVIDRSGGYRKYVNRSSGLSRKIVIGAYLEASLGLSIGGPSDRIAQLFLDAEKLIVENLAPKTPADNRDVLDSLERSRYGCETFVSSAMLVFAQTGNIPKAEAQFRRLAKIENLQTPIARYLLNYTQRAYVDGGLGYQNRLQVWLAGNTGDEYIYEVLFALAKDHDAKRQNRDAQRNYRRLVEMYSSKVNGDPVIRSYVVESALNVMGVYARQGDVENAREMRDRFIQLASPSDVRIEQARKLFQDDRN